MTVSTSHTDKTNSGDSLPNSLYKNIDCLFFESIVSGELRPFLDKFNSEKELRKLNSITVGKKIEPDIEATLNDVFESKKIAEELNLNDGDELEILLDEDNKSITIRIKAAEDKLEELIDIDIPPPFDMKSEHFLNYIERKYYSLLRNAQKVFDSPIEEKELALYANKNIQRLKVIAVSANLLYKRLSTKSNSFLDDSNVFVIYVVKLYIIRAIIYLQELFHHFTKIPAENYYDLEAYLYNEPHISTITKNFEKSINLLKYQNINDIFEYIKKGIYQVEMYMKGVLKDIQYFNLKNAFSKLQEEVVKIENYKSENFQLIDFYASLLYTLNDVYKNDQNEPKYDADNKNFQKMIKDVSSLSESVPKFLLPIVGEPIESKISILDFMNENGVNSLSSSNSQETVVKQKKISKNELLIPSAYQIEKYSAHLSKISDMFNSLIKNNFISKDTNLKEFRKIFNNTSPDSPIIWTGNISELYYFVKLLHYDFKLIDDLKINIWKVTANLFVDVNENPFDWMKFRKLKNPSKAKIIETCVSNLK
jgi:bifunctional DNA-binding transcriptional regulator/antitoxin component of YhaV-PrlF toxin-antitoxin module